LLQMINHLRHQTRKKVMILPLRIEHVFLDPNKHFLFTSFITGQFRHALNRTMQHRPSHLSLSRSYSILLRQQLFVKTFGIFKISSMFRHHRLF